jgi:hypothetical protein
VELDIFQWSVGSLQHFAGLFFGGAVIHDQFYALVPSQIANDFCVDPGDGVELAGPISMVVGPSQPGCGVGFPFGGHVVAEFHRRSTQDIS